MRVLNRVPKSLAGSLATCFAPMVLGAKPLPISSLDPVALMQFWLHTAHLPLSRNDGRASNPLTNNGTSTSSPHSSLGDADKLVEGGRSNDAATIILTRSELELSRRGAAIGVLPKDLSVELAFKPWAMPQNQSDTSGNNTDSSNADLRASASSKAKMLPRYFVKRSNGTLAERGKPVKGAPGGMEMPKVPTAASLSQTMLPSPPTKGAQAVQSGEEKAGNASRWEPNFSIFGSSGTDADASNQDSASNSVPGDAGKPRQFGSGPKKTPATASWLEQASMGASSGVLAMGSLSGAFIGSTLQTHPEDDSSSTPGGGEKDVDNNDENEEDPINLGLKSLSSFSSGLSSFMIAPAGHVAQSRSDKIPEDNEEEETSQPPSGIIPPRRVGSMI